MPGARQFPRVDDHIVEPETRQEMLRGQLLLAPPAKEPHAEQHSRLSAEVEIAVAPGYIVACDLLTRVNEGSNFATDVSVRKAGIDPSTGARYLEELSFEVVAEQSRREITMRAEDLSERGVRRVIAIFVKSRTVEEWLASEGRWQVLDPEGRIDDPTLVTPLEVRALLDTKQLKDAIARALHQQGNPQLRRYEAEAEAKGRRAGKREGEREGQRKGEREGKCQLLALVLERRFGPLPEPALERLAHAEVEQLDAWALRLLDAATLDEVLRSPGSS